MDGGKRDEIFTCTYYRCTYTNNGDRYAEELPTVSVFFQNGETFQQFPPFYGTVRLIPYLYFLFFVKISVCKCAWNVCIKNFLCPFTI